MFTGLVEDMGRVVACIVDHNSAKLTVTPGHIASDARIGDSIAVNGCCLTVVENKDGALTFDAVPETLHRTNLGGLHPGDNVNLERPLQAGARLGGHFVQGHIDGVAVVTAVRPEENAVVLEFQIPLALSRYFVEKGSVSVDGVSFTVAGVGADTFTVWTIPHTREVTTLGGLEPGDRVNIECDLLGKYIERLLQDRGTVPDA